jgi:hypothetical protein
MWTCESMRGSDIFVSTLQELKRLQRYKRESVGSA